MAGPAPRTWKDKAGDWVYVTLSQIRKKNKSCSGTGQLFSAFWKWKQEDRYSRLTTALGQKRKTRDPVLKPQQS